MITGVLAARSLPDDWPFEPICPKVKPTDCHGSASKRLDAKGNSKAANGGEDIGVLNPGLPDIPQRTWGQGQVLVINRATSGLQPVKNSPLLCIRSPGDYASSTL
jgi:hypothetical protein